MSEQPRDPTDDEVDFTSDEVFIREPATESTLLFIIATVTSYVFHPLLLLVYAFFFVDIFFPYQFMHLGGAAKMQLLLALIINTIVFPVATLGLMRGLKIISDFQLNTSKERILPFIAIMLFYFWTYLVIKKLGVGDYFVHVTLGASFGIFLAFFFNVFYKISLHAVGAGGFLGIALTLTLSSTYNLLFPLLLVIVIAGLVGSSRLFLGAHSPREVLTGYMVGILGQMVAFAYF